MIMLTVCRDGMKTVGRTSLILQLYGWKSTKRSGGSRLGHKVSGTWSKFQNLNETGQTPHLSRGFSDSEAGQNFVQIRH